MSLKKILCLDFDGVLHAYTSGWLGANVIPDGPVPGAMPFLVEAAKRFRVAIYSSRSGQEGGIPAMKFRIASWLKQHLLGGAAQPLADFSGREHAQQIWRETLDAIEWPTEKPPAFVTLDDRAICFNGRFPHLDDLANFEPWSKLGAVDLFKRGAATADVLASVAKIDAMLAPFPKSNPLPAEWIRLRAALDEVLMPRTIAAEQRGL